MAKKMSLERVKVTGEIKKISGEEMNTEFQVINQKFDEKIREGKQFLEDKKSLEEAIQMIEDSDLSLEDKKVQLMILKESLGALKQKYDEHIERAAETYEQESLEILKMVEGNIETVQTQTENLQKITLESGAVHLEKTIEASKNKASYFNELRQKQSEELQLRIDQMNLMRREMLRNKFKKQ